MCIFGTEISIYSEMMVLGALKKQIELSKGRSQQIALLHDFSLLLLSSSYFQVPALSFFLTSFDDRL